MTQDYLNQLFENYTGVEKFYWTADGTAFKSIDDAMKYANRLTDPTVKAVAHGGKLEDAKVLEDGIEQDVETGDLNPAAVATGNDGGAADVEIAKMKIKDLRALCKIRNVDFDKDATKEQLIELLQAKAKADAENTTKDDAIDYTTMDVEALQKLCNERGIEITGEEDAEKLIQLLTEWDAAQAPQE